MSTIRKRKTIGDPPAEAPRPKQRIPLINPNDPVAMARLSAAIAALDPEVEAEALRWNESVMDDTDWLPQE